MTDEIIKELRERAEHNRVRADEIHDGEKEVWLKGVAEGIECAIRTLEDGPTGKDYSSYLRE